MRVSARSLVLAEQVAGEATDQSKSKKTSKGASNHRSLIESLLAGEVQDLKSRSSETRLPHDGTMPLYDQGNTNGCGTTSLAMIMSYLLGRPVTQAEVDHAIRRMDVFTSPRDMIEFAQANGLAAAGYNHGS